METIEDGVKQVISENGNHKLQQDKLSSLVDSIYDMDRQYLYEGLKLIINLLISENLSLITSRHIFSEIFTKFKNAPPWILKDICIFTLEKIQPRVISFEEQAVDIRIMLGEIFKKEEKWKDAAEALIGIPIETGQKQYSKEFKIKIYMEIAELYIQAGDDAQAETYINRASLFQADLSDKDLQLQYKKCYAKVLDHRHKFLEAAQRYLEISYKSDLPENERLEYLNRAIHCTVLASAGPQRSRMLANLYKDERCQCLPSFGILEKMYLNRIIRREEMKAFLPHLSLHQIALTTDGTTILERAIVQHNILSASMIYENISFSELSKLLDIPSEEVEMIASHMIKEGRMEGHIDQIKSFVHFKRSNYNQIIPIQNLCNDMNHIIEKIKENCPEWINKFCENEINIL